MKLPKLLIILGLFSFLLTIFATPIWADCPLSACIPGDYGRCEEGAVVGCLDQQRKCVNGSWEPTDEPGAFLCSRTSPLEGDWFEPSTEEYESTLRDAGKSGEVSDIPWTQRNLVNLTHGLRRLITGPLPTEEVGNATSYQPKGAIGGISNLIAAMYANPPASSVEYFADLGKNLGIVKPAYAQGIGFEGLKPILPIWKAFRNIAYLFFTIIFVIMGFAIMFRVKLDPQTVISIQNAIPRVVVALILVTFSYAIAGLLIDLIYVIFFLFVGALRTSDAITPAEATGAISNFQGSFLKTMWGITGMGLSGVWKLIKGIIF